MDSNLYPRLKKGPVAVDLDPKHYAPVLLKGARYSTGSQGVLGPLGPPKVLGPLGSLKVLGPLGPLKVLGPLGPLKILGPLGPP